MGSSEGSQFLSEYPGGMRCRLASVSVALGVGGGFFGDVVGRAVCGRVGVDDDWRRRLGVVGCGEPPRSSLSYAYWA
jgi:hypothetical protein